VSSDALHFPAHFRAPDPGGTPHPVREGRGRSAYPAPAGTQVWGGHPYTSLLTSGPQAVPYAPPHNRELQGGEQLFSNKSTPQKALAATRNRPDIPRAPAAGRMLTPCSGSLSSGVLSRPSRSWGRADSAVSRWASTRLRPAPARLEACARRLPLQGPTTAVSGQCGGTRGAAPGRRATARPPGGAGSPRGCRSRGRARRGRPTSRRGAPGARPSSGAPRRSSSGLRPRPPA
jgi:hypothetical protein